MENRLKLNFSHQQGNFTLQINQEITFTGILGIFGHSGSGKTTLLRVLAGLNQHAMGEVAFNQQSFQHTRAKQFITSEQRQVSMVFQDSRLFPHLSVKENLLFARKRCKQPQLNFDEIIQLTGIKPILNSQIDNLSSGQQQRVALARAILSEPQLLLLDEPLSALDRVSRATLVTVIKKVQTALKLPMIYVSHSSEELQQLADQLIVISEGKVIDFGDIHQVIHQLNHTNLIEQQTSLMLPITQINHQHKLIELSCFDQPIYLSETALDLPLNKEECIGQKLRCYLYASDISITIKEPSDSSIVNLLYGQITAIEHFADHVLVTVSCHQQPFFASISSFSLEKLSLIINQYVYIQFKVNAVRTMTQHLQLPTENHSRITC